MRKLGLGALAIAAGALLLSAWMFRSQDASTRRDPPGVTISYEAGSAYVWEWKGAKIVGLTTYKPEGADVVKRRWKVTEEQK